MNPADMDRGARLYQRGVGDEEEEERGGGEVNHGVVVVSRVIACRPPMRCARWRTINHDRTTPAEKATLSRLGHQWATSEARTHLFQSLVPSHSTKIFSLA